MTFTARARRSGGLAIPVLALLFAGSAPGVAAPDEEDEDPAVKALALRLADWEESAAKFAQDGLEVRGFLAPDALAYKAAATYLKLRRGGMEHPAAIEKLRESLPRWKRYDGASLFVLRMHNTKFEVDKDTRRVYTQTEDLARDGVAIHAVPKTRIKAQLGGLPANLRLAEVKIQKFWTTADGYTRKVRPRDPDDRVRDPASIGRKEKLSKPFKALVLEKEPAEVELLVRRAPLEKLETRSFQVDLLKWKVYEGPWSKDSLDLNERRSWKELEGVMLEVALPPSGWTVSDEIQAILDEARKRVEAPEKE